jgi:hypothetical protein
MDLSREPLRLTMTEDEDLVLASSPLRLVQEDEFVASPLRLLGEARKKAQPQPQPAQPQPVQDGPGFFARAISGFKGQQSGEGTMAHHIGQFLKSRTAAGKADAAHQSRLLDLKRDTELQGARTGLASQSAKHQKATTGYIKANQARQAALAAGRTTTSLPAGGPAGGTPPGAPPATPPGAPPAPPAGGGGNPPPPAPAPGGNPPGVNVRKIAPPPEHEMKAPVGGKPPTPPAPGGGGGAKPPEAPAPAPAAPVKKATAKPVPTKAIHDVMKSGGDTHGKLTALHAVHGHDVNDPAVKKNIADLHAHAQKLHEKPPEAPKPAEAPKPEASKPPEAPKPSEPAKPAAPAKPAGYSTSWVSKGEAPSWAGQKPQGGMFNKGGSSPKPPKPAKSKAPPISPAPTPMAQKDPATQAKYKAKGAALGKAAKKAQKKPDATPPAASGGSGGEEKGGEKGPGRPRTRPNSHGMTGGKCPPGETQVSGGHSSDAEGGGPQCQKTPGGGEKRGEGGGKPVAADVFDLIADLKILTANIE